MRRAAGIVGACGWVVGLVWVVWVAGLLLFAGEARAQVPPPSILETPASMEKLGGPKATPGRTKLEYVVGPGVPGCDHEDLFRLWITSDIGKDPFAVEGPPLFTVRVSITRQGVPVRGRFELFDAEGNLLAEQEILERTCVKALDWLSLELAVVVFLPPPSCENRCTRALRERIEEVHTEGQKERDATGTMRGELKALRARLDAEHEERVAAEKALRAEMKRRRFGPMDLTYALSAGALITANLTPDVGPGVWLGGEVRAGPLSVGLELRAVLPSRVQVGPYDADLSNYVALVVPCGRYSYFFGCAVAGGGFAMGYDSNAPGGTFSPSGSMLQLGARLGAEVPFAENRFAARAWGEVLYSTPHVSLGYDTVNGVPTYNWDRPDVSAFFGLGLVVKFGNEETR